jgi:hypothetical protein
LVELQTGSVQKRCVMGNRLLLFLLMALAACDATKERNSCPGPAGSITDLAAEPAYSAPYLHRWAVEDCPVRLDVLVSRDSGCGPRDLVMGTPLGTIAENRNARMYVRGDTSGLGGRAIGFRPDATLPPSATDTGFRQGVTELWMVPNDDAFVFIRSSADGRVEAWPLDRSPIGCL